MLPARLRGYQTWILDQLLVPRGDQEDITSNGTGGYKTIGCEAAAEAHPPQTCGPESDPSAGSDTLEEALLELLQSARAYQADRLVRLLAARGFRQTLVDPQTGGFRQSPPTHDSLARFLWFSVWQVKVSDSFFAPVRDLIFRARVGPPSLPVRSVCGCTGSRGTHCPTT
ncbi:hypothetical protein CRD60_03325 [Bifidobacterium aemilianum]|uniref:Uncharacterized protein n=1 Tax=Bifidobacterium aemilianum TaxID=2493120 RepID=A0A366K930_9BIFI|nr:hypothetical protein CRD60_03325 [Bifidobacterium aemilianum]